MHFFLNLKCGKFTKLFSFAERSSGFQSGQSGSPPNSVLFDSNTVTDITQPSAELNEKIDNGNDIVVTGPGGEVKSKRQCVPFQVDFCSYLPYNFTTFPNAMGHKNMDDAKHDVRRFK